MVTITRNLEDLFPENPYAEMDSWNKDLEELEKIRLENINTIPEVNFVRVFLPFFNGDEENNIYKVNMNHWKNIAGGVYNPVNVANEHGEILYTVPAIFDNASLNSKTFKQIETLGQMTEAVKLMAHQSPNKSYGMFRTYMTNLFNELIDNKLVLDNIITWNQIFTRYNLEPIVISGVPELEEVNKNHQSNQIEQTDDLGDDFEIDPL